MTAIIEVRYRKYMVEDASTFHSQAFHKCVIPRAIYQSCVCICAQALRCKFACGSGGGQSC